MEKFHLSVGKAHGAKPAAIVSEISNVAGLTDKEIGRIELLVLLGFLSGILHRL